MTLGGLLLVLGIGAAAVAVIVTVWAHVKVKTVVKPSEGACDCDDIGRIFARQRVAKAAIESIDKLMSQDTGEMYTGDRYEAGKMANQKAVWKASEGDEATGSGETLPSNCKPDVSKGTSPCMKASLLAHENVHQRECLKYNLAVGDYKKKKTMLEYWKEDREGYEEEVKYLDRHFERVMAKCRQASYPGAETKEEQQQRLTGSKRRVAKSVGLPS